METQLISLFLIIELNIISNLMLPLFNLNRRSLQSIYLSICLFASVCLSQNASPQATPPTPTNYTSFNFTQLNTENLRGCGDQLYCSPLAGDVWRLGSKHLIIWYNLFPELVVSDQVDVRVYLSENPRESIIERLNIQNKGGKLSVDIDKNEFYKFDKNAKVDSGYNYILKQAYYVVTPAGSMNQNPRQSPYFSIVDTDPPGLPTPTPTSTPTPTQTPTETATQTPSPSPTPEPNTTSLPAYSIALIVIASLTGLVTVATIIYVLLSKRNEARNDDSGVAGAAVAPTQLEKGDGAGGTVTLDNNPDSSVKPVPAMVMSSRDSAQTQNSTTPLAPNTNLSSTDAQMLSETFRNMMRKPSWTTEQQYPSNLAKQRLEEELEREGVGLQDIQPKKLMIQTEPEESPIQPPAPSRPPNP
ncbi:hypothetical protein CONCODRAFT_86198 [Conidiobolus coronatus NRRL 28638]|uniref:Uncharacterized protein n=1 Tax=Conidiobolus coronatus (strain ATCC 28846 / CBS 209.66 / NRRL 28638) TaxID=796925 RepID=A0A137P1N6_CONC2|nr:hypothetical protein CONCODRAFT_86198 [Conidiobolus coronatus NRRL 28638]|eukprot:KXN68970.1 hypothetical protein CONCODRAFT_86198 [Conidiobolus coronatus NRRL 28638]